MNDLFGNPPFVQAGETTNVLISLARAKSAKMQGDRQRHVLDAKELGDILLEIKRRCNKIGEWSAYLKDAAVSSQDASNCMRLASNWERLNHPSSVREALRMLAEEGDEPQEPEPLPPKPANPPLCQKCARSVRTGQPPTKGCRDCKQVREADEAARQAATTWAPQHEGPSTEGAEDAGEDQEESTPEPPKPKKQEAVPTMVEFAQIAGQFLKAIDTLAKAIGHKTVHSRPDMADSVVETREVLGFRRRIEELKNDVAKWLKSAKRNNQEE